MVIKGWVFTLSFKELSSPWEKFKCVSLRKHHKHQTPAKENNFVHFTKRNLFHNNRKRTFVVTPFSNMMSITHLSSIFVVVLTQFLFTAPQGSFCLTTLPLQRRSARRSFLTTQHFCQQRNF